MIDRNQGVIIGEFMTCLHSRKSFVPRKNYREICRPCKVGNCILFWGEMLENVRLVLRTFLHLKSIIKV